jgi:beta-phosphoglucomutase-like phosphatase (HAD superfamily)
MDGVLIDSEQLMSRSAILALKEFGVEAQPWVSYHTWARGKQFYRHVARKYNVEYQYAMKYRAYEIYDMLVCTEAKLFPHIKETLTTLKSRGYKIS